MSKTLEQKTAKTILQHPERVEIGGKHYNVAKPSTATLIMASAAISKLPNFGERKEATLSEVLRVAKDAGGLGDVVAILLIGAKGLNHIGPRRWIKLFRLRRMKRTVLEDLSENELNVLTLKLLSFQDINSFFALITFLTGVNITKATKVITTASGQQSAAS